MKLSKNAFEIFKTIHLPKVICKIIGAMIGTDMSLTPGSRFQKISDYRVFKLQYLGRQDLEYNTCAVNGISIRKFEVVRVTPCFAYIKIISEHRIFSLVCRNTYRTKKFGFQVQHQYPRYTPGRPQYYRYGISFCTNDIIPPSLRRDMDAATIIPEFRQLGYDPMNRRITIQSRFGIR